MGKIIIFPLMIFFTIPAFANGAFDQTQRGAKAFEQELFGNAQAAFQDTLNKRKGKAEAHYNLGTALYKNNNYIDAENEFLSAAEKTRNKSLAASSYYNAGNSALKFAQIPGKEEDIKEARKRAIDHYRRALRINPEHVKAAHNLEKLYRLSQQEQESSSQQNEDGQENEDGQGSKQNQEGKQQSGNQNPDKNQNDQQQNSEEQQKENDMNGNPEEKESENEQDALSDEAEDLVDREEAQQEMRNKQQQNNLQVERDW